MKCEWLSAKLINIVICVIKCLTITHERFNYLKYFGGAEGKIIYGFSAKDKTMISILNYIMITRQLTIEVSSKMY